MIFFPPLILETPAPASAGAAGREAQDKPRPPRLSCAAAGRSTTSPSRATSSRPALSHCEVLLSNRFSVGEEEVLLSSNSFSLFAFLSSLSSPRAP